MLDDSSGQVMRRHLIKRADYHTHDVHVFCSYENTQWWNIQRKREQTTLWTLTNEKCGPTTKAKTEKTSRREREGGGKKGENKIKLESEEERRARLREKQVIQGERERERERERDTCIWHRYTENMPT